MKKQEEASKLLQQRDSQIAALSDNLVLVRTELEKSGRRIEELEDLAKSLNQQIEGKNLICSARNKSIIGYFPTSFSIG